LQETEPVLLPAGVLVESSPAGTLGMIALGFTLLKEVSGEAAIAREQAVAEVCDCIDARTAKGRQNVYLSATEHRFKGVRRCC
ncbi:MAG: Carbon starvation protein CstA, partial [Chthoniobacteraceae bacterium]|nr:Carbon starvation protein CstA [Chthoniobacteraceae bacterium]